jgi:hypothetical protein
VKGHLSRLWWHTCICLFQHEFLPFNTHKEINSF